MTLVRGTSLLWCSNKLNIYIYKTIYRVDNQEEVDLCKEKHLGQLLCRGRTWIRIHWEDLEVTCVFSTVWIKVVLLQGIREVLIDSLIKTENERKWEETRNILKWKYRSTKPISWGINNMYIFLTLFLL